jgi:hypothetical protein
LAARARKAVRQARERIEVEKTLHSNRGSLSLTIGSVAVLALVATDSFPAWMASEALGEGFSTTVIVTVLLVLALAGFAALMGHFQRVGNRRRFVTAGLLAAGVIALEGGLRLEYLLVTTTNPNPMVSSLLQVGLYTAITGGLTWASYEVLKNLESSKSYAYRGDLSAATRQLRAADMEVERAKENLDRATSAYESLTNPGSTRASEDSDDDLLDDDELFEDEDEAL